MVKCYTKQRKDGSNYTTCNKDIKENKPKPKPKPSIDKDLFLDVSKVLTEVAKRKADEKYKSYTIEELKRSAKNWAKVNRFKLKGINNISRKGLITLHTKEKVSMDFLKFNIREIPKYTSTMSGKKQISGGQSQVKEFKINKDKPFKKK